jgi:hypothetical protein
MAFVVVLDQSGIMLSREKVFVKNTMPGFINRLRMMQIPGYSRAFSATGPLQAGSARQTKILPDLFHSFSFLSFPYRLNGAIMVTNSRKGV